MNQSAVANSTAPEKSSTGVHQSSAVPTAYSAKELVMVSTMVKSYNRVESIHALFETPSSAPVTSTSLHLIPTDVAAIERGKRQARDIEENMRRSLSIAMSLRR